MDFYGVFEQAEIGAGESRGNNDVYYIRTTNKDGTVILYRWYTVPETWHPAAKNGIGMPTLEELVLGAQKRSFELAVGGRLVASGAYDADDMADERRIRTLAWWRRANREEA